MPNQCITHHQQYIQALCARSWCHSLMNYSKQALDWFKPSPDDPFIAGHTASCTSYAHLVVTGSVGWKALGITRCRDLLTELPRLAYLSLCSDSESGSAGPGKSASAVMPLCRSDCSRPTTALPPHRLQFQQNISCSWVRMKQGAACDRSRECLIDEPRCLTTAVHSLSCMRLLPSAICFSSCACKQKHKCESNDKGATQPADDSLWAACRRMLIQRTAGTIAESKDRVNPAPTI